MDGFLTDEQTEWCAAVCTADSSLTPGAQPEAANMMQRRSSTQSSPTTAYAGGDAERAADESGILHADDDRCTSSSP